MQILQKLSWLISSFGELEKGVKGFELLIANCPIPEIRQSSDFQNYLIQAKNDKKIFKREIEYRISATIAIFT